MVPVGGLVSNDGSFLSTIGQKCGFAKILRISGGGVIKVTKNNNSFLLLIVTSYNQGAASEFYLNLSSSANVAKIVKEFPGLKIKKGINSDASSIYYLIPVSGYLNMFALDARFIYQINAESISANDVPEDAELIYDSEV